MAREVVITCDQCGKRIRCVAIVYKPHPFGGAADRAAGGGDKWFCDIICIETWLSKRVSKDG